MSGMDYRYFTVAEARALLPQVKRHMTQIQRARAELLELHPEVWPVLKKALGNGGAPAVVRALEQSQRLQRAVHALLKLGVQVKDLDQGLVDFPSLRDGHEVCLCWKHGEIELAWWHEPEAGFAGRQPLDE